MKTNLYHKTCQCPRGLIIYQQMHPMIYDSPVLRVGHVNHYTTEVVTVLYSPRQKRHESMKYMYYWNDVYLCLTLSFAYISIQIQIFLFPIKEPFRAEQLTKNLIQ